MQHPHIASFFRACVDSNPPLLVSELYRFGNVMVYLSELPDANRGNMVRTYSMVDFYSLFVISHKVLRDFIGNAIPACTEGCSRRPQTRKLSCHRNSNYYKLRLLGQCSHRQCTSRTNNRLWSVQDQIILDNSNPRRCFPNYIASGARYEGIHGTRKTTPGDDELCD